MPHAPTLHILPEADVVGLLTLDEAREAVRLAYCAHATGDAAVFPVVREALADGDAIFGFKSGFIGTAKVLGVKGGGYWPHNGRRHGLANHQSSIVLFEADTGRFRAVIGANWLTAIRTAAASALSIDLLARLDAEVLAVVGCGGQAEQQVRAALRVRPFGRIVLWNRTAERAVALAERLADLAAEVVVEATCEAAVGQADVVITIVSAFAPVVSERWARPGQHYACMGTDTRGKIEVDPHLVATARLIVDDIAQATTIGETQHAINEGLVAAGDIVGTIGEVALGRVIGRRAPDEITLFDSTGVALQDLAVAEAALARAAERGLGVRVPYA